MGVTSMQTYERLSLRIRKIVVRATVTLGIVVIASSMRSPCSGQDYTKRWALIIGVGEYEDERFEDLEYPVNDADAIYKALRDEFDYQEPSLKRLTREVTREAAIDSVKCFAKEATADDSFLFYFSGHGSPNNARRTGFLDFTKSVPHRRETQLAFDDLVKEVSSLKCRHKAIILDCCYSGAITAVTPQRPVAEVAVTPADGGKNFLAEGFWVVSAGRFSPVGARREGKTISALTDALLQVMHDRAGSTRDDQRFRIRDLALRATEAVERFGGSAQRPDFEALNGARDGQLEFRPSFYRPTPEETRLRREYGAMFRNADAALQQGRLDVANGLLKDTKKLEDDHAGATLRGFEARFLQKQIDTTLWSVRPDDVAVYTIDVHPREELFLVAEQTPFAAANGAQAISRLRICDLKNGGQVKSFDLDPSFRGGLQAIWHPSGDSIAWVASSVRPGDNGKPTFVNKVGYHVYQTGESGSNEVAGLISFPSFSKDGSLFAWLKSDALGGSQIEVYRNTPDGKRRRILSVPGFHFALGDQDAPIVVAGHDAGHGKIEIYDADGQKLGSFRPGYSVIAVYAFQNGRMVTFHEAGAAARGNIEARSWEWKDGRAALVFTARSEGRFLYPFATACARREEIILTSGDAPVITAWTSLPSVHSQFRGPDRFSAVGTSGDFKYVVAANGSGDIRCWDSSVPQNAHTLNDVGYLSSSFAVSHNQKELIATGIGNAWRIGLPNFTVSKKSLPDTLRGGRIRFAAADDSLLLASVSNLTLAGRTRRIDSWRPFAPAGTEQGEFSVEGGGAFAVNRARTHVAYAKWTQEPERQISQLIWEGNSWSWTDAKANTAQLVIAKLPDGEIVEADALKLPTRIACVEWSPTAELVAVAHWSQDDKLQTNSMLSLVDRRTAKVSELGNGAGFVVTCLAFDPKGQYLAAGCTDSAIRIWHLATKEGPTILHGHVNRVTSVEFFPDLRRLISGGEDRLVILWDPTTGEPLMQLRAPGDINDLALLDGGDTIVAATSNEMAVWTLRNLDLRKQK
jgi:hypothetical protein